VDDLEYEVRYESKSFCKKNMQRMQGHKTTWRRPGYMFESPAQAAAESENRKKTLMY